jgi:hypothetical protein
MNYRQRAYDSYDRSNYNLKITNSYYHFKNIQKILFRKPEYKTIKKPSNSPKYNMSTRPYHNYFVLRQNELYKKVLNDIKTTKVKPKVNAYYKMKEEKLRDYRRQSKTLENRQLLRENSSFKKRLRNQKSMLRIRDMDRDYKLNHLKMMDRSKKIRELRNIILPPISTIVNRIKSPKIIKKYSSHDYKSYRTPVSKDGESSLHRDSKIETTE